MRAEDFPGLELESQSASKNHDECKKSASVDQHEAIGGRLVEFTGLR
jgi:hypothetical protein